MGYIEIKGAKVNNLKNLDLKIPRDKLIVMTGLSGSGKSSLAFDTLYAEGQRRYVESLSSYARQFLGRIDKPEVDYIKGIPPAIAIEQKVNTRNPRSTVGTSTEIYEYLKLLFARIGKIYSPISGEIVKKFSVSDIIDYIFQFALNSKALILCPLDKVFANSQFKSDIGKQIEILQQQGFSRIEIPTGKDDSTEKIFKISDILTGEIKIKPKSKINIVIDRFIIQNDEDTISRAADSIQTAFYEGQGELLIKIWEENNFHQKSFHNSLLKDGILFEEPSTYTFSFNNPVGACPTCEGFGNVMGIDPNLVIPNKSLSIFNEAVVCWRGEKMSWYKDQLISIASKIDFPIHKPFYQLTDKQKAILWDGFPPFPGLHNFFKMLEKEIYKIQNRVMLSRYKGRTVCSDCMGTRLKKEAGYVKVDGRSLHEIVLMPLHKLLQLFESIKLNENDLKISNRLLIEIKNRLKFLIDVGLGYLNLNRLSSTLSGGESQRINLANSLGSSLVGSLYILDEPSIGLHSRDTARLIKVLKQLRNIGNTVIVVEHDEEIMENADQIIDLGPLAGRLGGEIVFQGSINELPLATNSLTAQYLLGKEKIEVPTFRRKWNSFIEVIHARENNLQNVHAVFPLSVLTVVTGVSGSGKSSLVKSVLYSALKKKYDGHAEISGNYDEIRGDFKMIKGVEFVDQNPIGKSSRSNPVTYIKAYDEIRNLYADQNLAKISGYKASHFSFNVEGGRCEECQGEGIIYVEMQFMADVHLVCENCQGKRFKEEILEVRYNQKSIFDVLDMTIDEAIDFFSQTKGNFEKRIVEKLQLLSVVGLNYIKLGQSSSTLSGGESQRVKLATFLAKEKDNTPTIFIFDEPTTGLHFHDIKKLLYAINALIDRGHTVIVIEHNIEVIKCADWVIDLGPEGGEEGGKIIFAGIPEDLIQSIESYTGQFLKKKLGG